MDHNELEEFWEKLEQEGQEVYRYEWDSGGPGAGGDIERVYRYQNQYYLALSDGEGPQGPFSTFEQAVITGELFYISEATVKIIAPELDTEDLQAFLRYSGELSHTFFVNGQKWHTMPDGKLAPVEP